ALRDRLVWAHRFDRKAPDAARAEFPAILEPRERENWGSPDPKRRRGSSGIFDNEGGALGLGRDEVDRTALLQLLGLAHAQPGGRGRGGDRDFEAWRGPGHTGGRLEFG